jgi:phosphotransferase system enzyme I (PtsP)
MSPLSAPQESSLLLTLAEISELVCHSHDPGETLDNIVRLLQGRFHTDVCSVYLLEPAQGELVLGATIGLKPASVGRVRMRLDEGLTGLVAERRSPVMVDDAFQHPRFKYFPEAGEDPYHSFLGVPLVEAGALQGVLVVQTVQPRTFTPNEVRMLVTAASQLAPLVSEARLLEQVMAAHAVEAAPVEPRPEPASLSGCGLSAGIGLGRAYVVNGFDQWRPLAAVRGGDPALEQRRLTRALEAAHDEITRLSQRISTLVGDDHSAILQAQLLIMQDRTLAHDLDDCLRASCTAEGALLQTLDKYAAVFARLPTELFQERVYDLKDVFRRILWHLQPTASGPADGGERLVLVSREASVMDLFSVDLDRLAAVVVEHGGPQCHAAILARSLGVPMVGQVPGVVARLETGQQLLVDGQAGLVYLHPDNRLQIADCRLQIERQSDRQSAICNLQSAIAPARPRVEANINLLSEVAVAVAQQAVGVGLYRSEFLFLARRTLPAEEEQVEIYRKLLTQLQGRPASIRTFDLRPDKLAHLAAAATQALDWRLVLSSPPVQKLFKEQVRAILRAAAAGPARILVPLVTQTEQLDLVRETVQRARDELRREGLAFAEVPLGIMIEVAAATAMVDTWAGAVDFFALGTNDLIASALGIDRNDPVGTGTNDALHPGLLRIIHDVVTAAHGQGRPVTVCGEMAADPDGLLALAALGVDSVSVPANQLGAARRTVAEPPVAPTALASQLVELRTADQARDLLRRTVAKPG